MVLIPVAYLAKSVETWIAAVYFLSGMLYPSVLSLIAYLGYVIWAGRFRCYIASGLSKDCLQICGPDNYYYMWKIPVYQLSIAVSWLICENRSTRSTFGGEEEVAPWDEMAVQRATNRKPKLWSRLKNFLAKHSIVFPSAVAHSTSVPGACNEASSCQLYLVALYMY